jgi:hypothetical protein
MSYFKDPEVQRQGIVVVWYNTNKNRKSPSFKSLWRSSELYASLPIRVVSWHACILDRKAPAFALPFILSNLTNSLFSSTMKELASIQAHYGKR